MSRADLEHAGSRLEHAAARSKHLKEKDLEEKRRKNVCKVHMVVPGIGSVCVCISYIYI